MTTTTKRRSAHKAVCEAKASLRATRGSYRAAVVAHRASRVLVRELNNHYGEPYHCEGCTPMYRVVARAPAAGYTTAEMSALLAARTVAYNAHEKALLEYEQASKVLRAMGGTHGQKPSQGWF